MNPIRKWAVAFASLCVVAAPLRADQDVYLLGVPDYQWYAGCFGTACGNLMGYWDRHGMQNFYAGPTAGGVAPLNDFGDNNGIRSLWASKAGVDGRPADRPGHIDDYWLYYNNDSSYSYESTVEDPYMTAGRPEHSPDCIGDFIGLSQKKWTNMANECDGNIDAYSFVYWDMKGVRRTNYVPPTNAGLPAVDIQSGLRAWTRWRGYDADVFTQLADFNPEAPGTNGFTYQDVKAEIDAGYPLLVFLQPTNETSRSLSGMQRANPPIHGVMIFGYQEYPEYGTELVYVQTSWGIGSSFQGWTATPWLNIGLSVRGVIGFHPKPRVRTISRNQNSITLEWDGPQSQLYDVLAGATSTVHRYQVQRSTKLTPNSWSDVDSPTSALSSTVTELAGASAFYRIKLLN
ncbi:MAG TPA: hypothetical protein VJ063_00865 [Verrucomicrobiae bacterium]|nr:hypothetical protein [Verrucomicrobiae bacterium]